MKDITTMKLKTDLGLKKINFKKLKEPKLPVSLPRNSKLDNVFNISKGRSNSRGMNTMLRRNKLAYRGKISFNNSGNKGMTRIRQQKGLNPWGDHDGDKLINMLDCNPRNKYQQGPEHTLEDKINPEDELEREEVNEPVEEQQEKRMNRLQSFLQTRSADKEQTRSADKEQLRIEEEDLRAKAAQKARRYEEQRKVAQLTRIERERLRQKKPGFKEAIGQVGGTFGTISSAATSLGGFGISQSSLVQPNNASQYKILAALGKAPPAQEVYPQAPQMATQQQQTVSQAQANPQQGIKSPYSGRRVSYVRGPYKKGGQ